MSENTTKSDAAVFVPDEKTVTISGKVFSVHKFTVMEWIKLTKELTGFASSVVGKILSDNKNFDFNTATIFQMLPYMWEDLHRIVPMMALAINVEPKWLGEQQDFEGFSALFMAVAEQNNFKVVFENFSKGFQNLRGQWEQAAPARPLETS